MYPYKKKEIKKNLQQDRVENICKIPTILVIDAKFGIFAICVLDHTVLQPAAITT